MRTVYRGKLILIDKGTFTSAAADVCDGLHIKCNSYGPVQWYFKIQSHHLNVIKVAEQHHIYTYPVGLYSSGYYYCYGLDRNLTPFIAELRLKVYGMFRLFLRGVWYKCQKTIFWFILYLETFLARISIY